jgi:hypothetical protein
MEQKKKKHKEQLNIASLPNHIDHETVRNMWLKMKIANADSEQTSLSRGSNNYRTGLKID